MRRPRGGRLLDVELRPAGATASGAPLGAADRALGAVSRECAGVRREVRSTSARRCGVAIQRCAVLGPASGSVGSTSRSVRVEVVPRSSDGGEYPFAMAGCAVPTLGRSRLGVVERPLGDAERRLDIAGQLDRRGGGSAQHRGVSAGWWGAPVVHRVQSVAHCGASVLHVGLSVAPVSAPKLRGIPFRLAFADSSAG
jgi:hypothetical protein